MPTRIETPSWRLPAAVLLLLLPLIAAQATTYYVSTAGSDTNAGTLDAPFLTIAKAMALSSTLFRPGDTVLVRGGIYASTATISISKNGLSTARYFLLAYPGERPVLDFSAQVVNGSNRGILLKGNFWHIKGLDVKGAGDNGMNISGSHNTVEFCSFYENRDTGLQLGGGASNNRVINCDSFFNADPDQGNADGFAPKLDVGTGNYFSGCRSWQNSDDGWDGYLRGANDVTTTLESCWCFSNGYLKDGSPSSGNGNGYKTGGSDTKDLMHNVILNMCIAFDNRVKGFDQNNNRGSITVFNGSAYRNGTNYGMDDTLAFSRGKVLTLKNCLALGPVGTLHGAAVLQTNSWMPPFAAVTASDFLSVDTAGVRGPRKPDGSLPDIAFLFPTLSSQLVNAGTDVGLPFNGNAPDIGAFETNAPAGILSQNVVDDDRSSPVRSYPNPFNNVTVLAYRVVQRAVVSVAVFDIRGVRVRSLFRAVQEPGSHTLIWDATNDDTHPVASGVYFARVQSGGSVRTTRLMLMK